MGHTMLVTRAADYAIRVMIHLAALAEGERCSLPFLARMANAPGSFLSKILQNLARAGFIQSWRGNEGGFEILPRGREATIWEIIEVIDGPVFLNICLTSGRACERSTRCPAHRVWNQAQQSLKSILTGTSVSEMSAAASRLVNLGSAARPAAEKQRRAKSAAAPFATLSAAKPPAARTAPAKVAAPAKSRRKRTTAKAATVTKAAKAAR
jgi:Rrf2 family protein